MRIFTAILSWGCSGDLAESRVVLETYYYYYYHQLAMEFLRDASRVCMSIFHLNARHHSGYLCFACNTLMMWIQHAAGDDDATWWYIPYKEIGHSDRTTPWTGRAAVVFYSPSREHFVMLLARVSHSNAESQTHPDFSKGLTDSGSSISSGVSRAAGHTLID